jgi:hypothetical protein
MKKTSFWSAVATLGAALILSGCVSGPVAVPSTFWEQTSDRVLIVLDELPEHGIYAKEGSQGLLDVAINSAMATSEAKHLKQQDADAFREIVSIFEAELTAAGFQPIVYEDAFSLKDQPKLKGKQSGQFEYDLSGLAVASDADEIIVLRLVSFGASRTYYGFIPTSQPQGYAMVQGIMVDTEKNKILWDTGILEGTIKDPVVGEWNQEPDFPNLTEAMNRAVEKSKRFLKDRFFER